MCLIDPQMFSISSFINKSCSRAFVSLPDKCWQCHKQSKWQTSFGTNEGLIVIFALTWLCLCVHITNNTNGDTVNRFCSFCSNSYLLYHYSKPVLHINGFVELVTAPAKLVQGLICFSALCNSSGSVDQTTTFSLQHLAAKVEAHGRSQHFNHQTMTYVTPVAACHRVDSLN